MFRSTEKPKPCVRHPSGKIDYGWKGRNNTLRAIVVCDVCSTRRFVDEQADNEEWVRIAFEDYQKLLIIFEEI